MSPATPIPELPTCPLLCPHPAQSSGTKAFLPYDTQLSNLTSLSLVSMTVKWGGHASKEETSIQNLTVLVSFKCQLDTAWSHLRGKPQLRNCLDQIALWVCLWEVVLLFDAGGPSPLQVVPT